MIDMATSGSKVTVTDHTVSLKLGHVTVWSKRGFFKPEWFVTVDGEDVPGDKVQARLPERYSMLWLAKNIALEQLTEVFGKWRDLPVMKIWVTLDPDGVQRLVDATEQPANAIALILTTRAHGPKFDALRTFRIVADTVVHIHGAIKKGSYVKDQVVRTILVDYYKS